MKRRIDYRVDTHNIRSIPTGYVVDILWICRGLLDIHQIPLEIHLMLIRHPLEIHLISSEIDWASI